MEVITDNMYLDTLNRHKHVIRCTQEKLKHNQILLLDFDVYSKCNREIENSLYYVYKDCLPEYCSYKIQDFDNRVICIKHLDLCVLASV